MASATKLVLLQRQHSNRGSLQTYQRCVQCSSYLWQSGALTITKDAPADAAYAFTLANVTPEGFSYQGGSIKNEPNVAIVSYLDLDLRDTAYEVVEDQEQIEKWGAVRREVTAFACIPCPSKPPGTLDSDGKAVRVWVVSFTTSADAGVVVRPGQVIKIADPVRAGVRRGGDCSRHHNHSD